MAKDDREILTDLAAQHMTDEGREIVDDHISSKEIELARAAVLGAIDARWSNSCINDETAKISYQKLGVDPDRASQLRQRHTRP